MRRSVKWGLVAHTAALFLFLTVTTVMDLYIGSIEYIDNRNFPGRKKLPPGPIGYDDTLYFNAAFQITYNTMFPLSQWLADGLLVGSIPNPAAISATYVVPFPQLYRCYVVYSMNHRAMAFPYLLYTVSVSTSPIPLRVGGGAVD